MIDLAAAIEAAARADWESSRPEAEPTDLWWIEPWEDLSERQRQVGRNCARPVVEAAAPLIEAAVRDQVAQAIRAAEPSILDADPNGCLDCICRALSATARIARGEA